MVAEGEFQAWLRTLASVLKGREDLASLPCPHCGLSLLRYRLVGNLSTRSGYGAMWCENCWHGIRVSRVQVPPDTPMLSFEEEMAHPMPDFVEVVPTG